MTDWHQFDRDARKGASRGVLGILLLLAVIILVGAIVWGVKYVTADARGAGDARERTRADGNYRIAAYDAFYDKCAGVQALEDQIANAKADTSLPKDQRATNLLALRNQRAALIREYNADARKADTRAHFRASDLPYSIDPAQETTAC